MTMRTTFIAMAALCLFAGSAAAQGRGRGIPNATPEQNAAVTQMNAELAPQMERLAAARAELISTALATPANDAAIRTKVDAIRTAELDLARARAGAFTKLQASANRLTAEQAAAAGNAGGGGQGESGARPRGIIAPACRTSRPGNATALSEMSAKLQPALVQGPERRPLAGEWPRQWWQPRDDAAIQKAIDGVAGAELELARARGQAFAGFQTTPDRLDAEQVQWLVAAGGAYGGTGFTEPEPLDFNDHRGYLSLFDGVSLKGWDGNAKFWRAEGGAIVGESTPANPSGNTYIVYRDVTAQDFTLKFEIKVEGTGGSGIQYRSQTGLPWLRPIPANVIANTGPVNLSWMMTGPQADFWPSQIYSGQFYTENSPMGIMAFRGQVVEGAGLGAKRLMGTIGDRTELGKLVKANDWNEYTVIARGGTFIHILNGQLMAVMVDDDPGSVNNQPGLFGIEIEATTKVSVRNIWLKKFR